MKLSTLCRRLSALSPCRLLPGTGAEVELRQARFDSRDVGPQDLFCALPGDHFDGQAYVAMAKAQGAAAVLSTVPQGKPELPWIVVEEASDLRRLSALAAHEILGSPGQEMWLAAVTGTNGKSTVVHLLHQALEACGVPTALAGTLGLQVPGTNNRTLPEIHNTTPEADVLANWLHRSHAAQAKVAVLEASSHGIALERMVGMPLQAAAWTNLSHDHLDFHHSMEAYAAAKAQLFHALPSGAPALFPSTPLIETALAGMKATPVPWFLQPATAGAQDHDSVLATDAQGAALRGVARLETDGLVLDIDGFFGAARIHSGLIGMHNAENLLVAFGLACASGADRAAVAAALSQVGPAPGRLERVQGPEGCHLFVDYAHTPDALAHVLEALRAQYPGQRIGVVFGAGGDRDQAKRPYMGAAVGARADWCVVTSDNPRSEEPLAIAQDVAAGIPAQAKVDQEIIVDRRIAIREAVARLSPGDVLLVAGKGHETYQETHGVRRPFDDRQELQEALSCFL